MASRHTCYPGILSIWKGNIGSQFLLGNAYPCKGAMLSSFSKGSGCMHCHQAVEQSVCRSRLPHIISDKLWRPITICRPALTDPVSLHDPPDGDLNSHLKTALQPFTLYSMHGNCQEDLH